MDPADILSLLTGDEPTAQQKAQSMAAALRRQQAAGQLGLLTGDPVLSRFGQSQLQSAQAGQQQLVQAGETRLKRAMEAERQRVEDEFRRSQERHMSAEDAARQEQLQQGRYGGVQFNPITGAGYQPDTKHGGVREVVPAAAGGAPGLKPKQLEEEWKALAEGVSTYKGRGNLNRENQQRLNSAERLEALILGPGGQIQDLTPQQVREAGTALANLISSGSMSLSQIEELTPTTMAGRFAGMKQKLLNEPQGAEAQAFLQNMLETAGREKAVVAKQVRQGQLQALPNYAHLRGVDAGRFESILRGAGLDPTSIDERGLERMPAAPKGGSGLTPEQRKKRIEELRAQLGKGA